MADEQHVTFSPSTVIQNSILVQNSHHLFYSSKYNAEQIISLVQRQFSLTSLIQVLISHYAFLCFFQFSRLYKKCHDLSSLLFFLSPCNACTQSTKSFKTIKSTHLQELRASRYKIIKRPTTFYIFVARYVTYRFKHD